MQTFRGWLVARRETLPFAEKFSHVGWPELPAWEDQGGERVTTTFAPFKAVLAEHSGDPLDLEALREAYLAWRRSEGE